MKLLFFISLLIIATNSVAQVELSSRFEERPNDTLNSRKVTDHTSIKPLIRQENLLSNNQPEVFGIADLNYIQNIHSEFKTGAGVGIRGTFWDKLFIDVNFVGGFQETDSLFYPKVFIHDTSNVPSFYSDIRSRISFTPNKFFNFQAGLDNNFIGEGSRSLLLSDYGAANPFGLIRANFWRFEYSVLYQFLRERDNNQWEGKFNATHHISLNPTKWMNFGIFETVVFQPKDTLLNRGFDVEYLNPLVFYRPQEYSIGSSDNVLLGVEMSFFYKNQTLYGQFILDEFFLEELRAKSGWWANKFGGQLGIKGHFKVNQHRFFYRAEYNFVRPYTYSHISEELNYGNQGTSMAHPYHSNFMEILAEIKWSYKRFHTQLFSNYYVRGLDKDGYSYGGNMYMSYTARPFEKGHYIGQGIQMNGTVTSLKLSYELMKHGKMEVFIDSQARFNTIDAKFQTYIIGGIRSSLWNDYRNY